MRDANIGNDTDIRAGDGGKPPHLAEMIHAHLKDSNLMSIIHLRDCEGEPPFIVKIPQCLMHIIFLGEYRGDHLFCTRLACASRNAYNLEVKRVSVKLGDIKKRLTGRLDQYIRVVGFAEVFMGYHAESAGFHSIRNKLVGVDLHAVDGDKEITRPHFAAVDHYTVCFLIKIFRITMVGSLARFRDIL